MAKFGGWFNHKSTSPLTIEPESILTSERVAACECIKGWSIMPSAQMAEMAATTIHSFTSNSRLFGCPYFLFNTSLKTTIQNEITAVLNFFVALIMCAQSSAAPAPTAPLSKQCVQLEVPLLITANNSQFDLPRVDSNIDAVGWVWDLTTWSHRSENGRVNDVISVNDTFTISAQLCVPPQGNKSDILQIATHGIGFDKRRGIWCEWAQRETAWELGSRTRHGWDW